MQRRQEEDVPVAAEQSARPLLPHQQEQADGEPGGDQQPPSLQTSASRVEPVDHGEPDGAEQGGQREQQRVGVWRRLPYRQVEPAKGDEEHEKGEPGPGVEPGPRRQPDQHHAERRQPGGGDDQPSFSGAGHETRSLRSLADVGRRQTVGFGGVGIRSTVHRPPAAASTYHLPPTTITVSLDGVGDGDGDVVVTAGGVGRLDEGPDSLLWRAGAEKRADVVVVDHHGEPIGAEKETIPLLQRFLELVHLEVELQTPERG